MLEKIRLTPPTEGITGRTISIPISMDFNPMDNSELIKNWVSIETKKSINDDIDRETVRYFGELTINVNFYNLDNGTYSSDYISTGFNSNDINKKTNRFKNSYFRLYFYDRPDEQTRKLLFTEDLRTIENNGTTLNLTRLFWLKNDEVLKSNNQRDLYLTISFFNRSNGNVSDFLFSNNRSSSFTINEYSNNIEWRSKKITINNNRQFVPDGGNTFNVFETIVK